MMPPPVNNENMNSKEFLEFAKAMKEWQDSLKPKDEKKDQKPNPKNWDFGDQLIFICTVHSILAVIGTCAVLYFLTEFMKAVPHP